LCDVTTYARTCIAREEHRKRCYSIVENACLLARYKAVGPYVTIYCITHVRQSVHRALSLKSSNNKKGYM
jgi:hypothetical protein